MRSGSSYEIESSGSYSGNYNCNYNGNKVERIKTT